MYSFFAAQCAPCTEKNCTLWTFSVICFVNAIQIKFPKFKKKKKQPLSLFCSLCIFGSQVGWCHWKIFLFSPLIVPWTINVRDIKADGDEDDESSSSPPCDLFLISYFNLKVFFEYTQRGCHLCSFDSLRRNKVRDSKDKRTGDEYWLRFQTLNERGFVDQGLAYAFGLFYWWTPYKLTMVI